MRIIAAVTLAALALVVPRLVLDPEQPVIIENICCLPK